MKHNIYENGDLQNIEFNDNGLEKSVGVFEPGDYTLTSDREETIQCLTGQLIINNNLLLPGEKIVIERGARFAVSIKETASYICIYR